jgi:hypothetical protein
MGLIRGLQVTGADLAREVTRGQVQLRPQLDRCGNHNTPINSSPAQANKAATNQPGNSCKGQIHRKAQTSKASDSADQVRHRWRRPGRPEGRSDGIAKREEHNRMTAVPGRECTQVSASELSC